MLESQKWITLPVQYRMCQSAHCRDVNCIEGWAILRSPQVMTCGVSLWGVFFFNWSFIYIQDPLSGEGCQSRSIFKEQPARCWCLKMSIWIKKSNLFKRKYVRFEMCRLQGQWRNAIKSHFFFLISIRVSGARKSPLHRRLFFVYQRKDNLFSLNLNTK